MSPRIRWISLVVYILVCLGAGGLGAIAATPEIEGWYKTIEKPSWNPPDYVFGPVWTTLYVVMAVAAWLVWKPEGFKAAAMPLSLFGAQLVLNVVWSWIFFGMHQPGSAFAEIVILWLVIVATMVAFWPSNTRVEAIASRVVMLGSLHAVRSEARSASAQRPTWQPGKRLLEAVPLSTTFRPNYHCFSLSNAIECNCLQTVHFHQIAQENKGFRAFLADLGHSPTEPKGRRPFPRYATRRSGSHRPRTDAGTKRLPGKKAEEQHLQTERLDLTESLAMRTVGNCHRQTRSSEGPNRSRRTLAVCAAQENSLDRISLLG